MSKRIKLAILACTASILASCGTTTSLPKVTNTAQKDATQKSRFNPLSKSNKLKNQLGTVASQSEPTGLDPVANAAFWGTRYDRAPKNAEAAINFSQALRQVGSNEEALKVMSQSQLSHPDNPETLLEMGKVLIANDRAFEAVRPLQRSIALGSNQNWTAYSAYGVALDSIGEHKSARQQYDLALAIEPKAYSALNNKGLSYALSGKLDLAERTLRQAAISPGGTAKVRQNLALILSYSGKKHEAERLARSDLPPQIANNNIAYFRSLVAQPAYWSEFDQNNVEMPDFGATAVPTMRVESAPIVEEKAAPLPAQPSSTPAPTTEPAPTIQPTPEADILSDARPAAEGPAIDTLEQPAFADQPMTAWSQPQPPTPEATGRPVPLENTSMSPDDSIERDDSMSPDEGTTWTDGDTGS
ncbi:MAG: hypothetical protein ACWA5L_00315 [bacterium]